MHAVVDREGFDGDAVAGAQGVLRPRAVSLVHIDTSYKLPEMIAYRDRLAMEYRLHMVVGQDEAAIRSGRTFPATQDLPDGDP